MKKQQVVHAGGLGIGRELDRHEVEEVDVEMLASEIAVQRKKMIGFEGGFGRVGMGNWRGAVNDIGMEKGHEGARYGNKRQFGE